jgi:hypothetical protein
MRRRRAAAVLLDELLEELGGRLEVRRLVGGLPAGQPARAARARRGTSTPCGLEAEPTIVAVPLNIGWLPPTSTMTTVTLSGRRRRAPA